MNTNLKPRRSIDWVGLTCGLGALVIAATGLAGIVGWHRGVPILIQPFSPLDSPIQYNAALGLIALGAGSLATCLRRHRPALVCGALLVALGAATGWEYVVGADLGLAGMFLTPYRVGAVISNGRMAPPAAVCLLIAGLMMVLERPLRQRPWQRQLLSLLATAIAGIGLVAALGWVARIQTASDWGGFTRMAPQLAACMILTGVIHNLRLWQARSWSSDLSRFQSLAAPVGFGLLIATASLWLAMTWRESDLALRDLASQAGEVAEAIERTLGGVAGGLDDAGLRLESGLAAGDRAAAIGAIPTLADVPAVWLVHPDGREVWLRGSRTDGSALPMAAPMPQPADGNGAAATLSVLAGSSTADPRLLISRVVRLTEGTAVLHAAAALPLLLDPIMDPFAGSLLLELRDRPGPAAAVLVARGAVDRAAFSVAAPVQARGLTWRLEAAPGAEYGAGGGVIPALVAGAGILLSALTAGLIRMTAAARQGEASARLTAAALERGTAELTASNAELKQFTFIAAHDLQEPLRAITGFCQLLKRRYGPGLDATANEYIDFTVSGSDRLQRLLNALLTYSELPTASETAARSAPVASREILERVCRGLEAEIKASQGRITLGHLPEIRGDARTLQLAFASLLENALKFRGAARPDIMVEGGAERVDGRDFWVFRVRDNGIGIDPEHHGRIFGIFRRLHTQAEVPGTGLGLAIVKKVAEAHRGRIRVESALGHGSTFVLELPVQPSPA